MPRIMDCFLSEVLEAGFSMAFLLKINQKKMKRLEKEYTTMKCKEKEDEVELGRLRTENRLLRQRIDMLETESSELADKLIQGQVTRAEVEETTFAIKREHDIDTNQKPVGAAGGSELEAFISGGGLA